TRSLRDWSSDVCSSDLNQAGIERLGGRGLRCHGRQCAYFSQFRMEGFLHTHTRIGVSRVVPWQALWRVCRRIAACNDGDRNDGEIGRAACREAELLTTD